MCLDYLQYLQLNTIKTSENIRWYNQVISFATNDQSNNIIQSIVLTFSLL